MGNVVSRFGDNTWDFSSVSKVRKNYVFDSEMFTAQVLKEIKTLVYARLYYAPSARSITSLRQTPITRLAEWAQRNGVTITKMLNDRRLGKYLASSLASLEKRPAEEIASLIRELTAIRISKPELSIAPDSFQLADELGAIVDSLPEKATNQTLVIPTRIFSSLIISFESFISDFLAHESSIKALMAYLGNGLKTGGHLKTQVGFKKWYKRPDNYNKLLEDHGLSEFASTHSLATKKAWNTYLRDVQETSKYWIHLFTGMRNNEVNTLSRGCVSSLNTKGSKAKIVRGYTTKTLGTGASETFWITTDIVDIGISAARAIGEIIAIELDAKLDEYEFPLLPNHQMKRETRGDRFHENASSTAGLSGVRMQDFLRRFPALVVTKDDLAEIFATDGFNDLTERVNVGEYWPLATHQCRRSLAVYLAKSKLVSIGSLQLQFKHLMIEMTNYYRRNSTFATNFILNDEESEGHQSQIQLIAEIEKEKKVSELLDFETLVLGNPAEIWGGEGNRLRRDIVTGKANVILTDPKRRKEAFMNGELAFKEGPIGRCMNTEPCNKLSISDPISPCVGCSMSVGTTESFKNVDKALEGLYKTRDRYPINSLHYKQAQSDINAIENRINKAKESINGTK